MNYSLTQAYVAIHVQPALATGSTTNMLHRVATCDVILFK